MPANVVRSSGDEAKWARAKSAAAEQGQKGNYKLVMHIFQQMKKADEDDDEEGEAKPMPMPGIPSETEKSAKRHMLRIRREGSRGGRVVGHDRATGKRRYAPRESKMEKTHTPDQISDLATKVQGGMKIAKAMDQLGDLTSQNALLRELRKAGGSGAGSRGGKVIGTTSSGKPIYAPPDGLAAHQKKADAAYTKHGGVTKESQGAIGASNDAHREHFEETSKDYTPKDHLDAHKVISKVKYDKGHSSVHHEWAHNHISGLHVSAHDKKGRAERETAAREHNRPSISKAMPNGGNGDAKPKKVIGKTKDGQPVYAAEDKLQKKPGDKNGAKNGKPEEEEEGTEEGTHEHHRDKALAHLQAAQAHAGAATSAKKVDEAKEHKQVVGAAREASELAVPAEDEEVKKAEGSRGGTIIGHGRGGKPIYASTGSDHHQKMIDHHTKQARMKKQDAVKRSDHRHAAEAHTEAKANYDNIATDQSRGATVSASRHDEAQVRSAQANHSTASTHGMPRDVKDAAWLGKAEEPRQSLSKGVLHVGFSADDAVVAHLEGAVIGGQSAGIAENGSHRLLGMREERLEKGGVAGGTIYQGEHDAPRGGDFREPVARAQTHAQMVEIDEAGNAGNGGLDEWFEDAWSPGDPTQRVPMGMGPKASGWQKSQEPAVQIIDDSDPYTRATHNGHPQEHQSTVRMAYQGGEREARRRGQ